jgi:hypothetical protein
VIHLGANDPGSQGWVDSAPGPGVAEGPVSPAPDFLDVDAGEIHDASSSEVG